MREFLYQNLIRQSLQEGIELRQQMLELADSIEAGGRLLVETLASGGRLFFCGNGGSAADCQHLAAELVGRFEMDNQLPALALTTDSSILTAVANDFGYDQIYVRQLKALARKGDCLVAISTSGNSSNILRAVESARELGLSTVGLAGGQGGQLAHLCTHTLVVPSVRTCRVQEIHISVGHIWCEMVEEARRAGQLP
ncbi:MAG: SIS domain-containing protein [Vulcanimicrobiota bacterium]